MADDGIGFAPGAAPRGTGLGRRLVRALGAQLGGAPEVGPAPGGGTACRLSFPLVPD